MTVITENLFLEHRRARFFIFPEFFNVFPQPQTKPEVQKIFQSKVTPFRKWPHTPVLVCWGLGPLGGPRSGVVKGLSELNLADRDARAHQLAPWPRFDGPRSGDHEWLSAPQVATSPLVKLGS